MMQTRWEQDLPALGTGLNTAYMQRLETTRTFGNFGLIVRTAGPCPSHKEFSTHTEQHCLEFRNTRIIMFKNAFSDKAGYIFR